MPSSNASTTSFFSRLSGKDGGKLYRCTVQLLDDTDTINIEFKKNETGQTLLERICQHVQIVAHERDYFGLRYMDLNKHRYWLDPLKPVLKQVHGVTPIVFCLRVRYYPKDPTLLKDELTRYQLFLQLRRDMLHGRLYCPQTDAAYLGACVLQSELGDYCPREHHEGYVSEYKLFLKQAQKLEDKVAEVHKSLRGKNPAEAELAFLERAATLDTYGFDPYTVKESKTGNGVYVGCTAIGFLVYHLNRKVHSVPWTQVEKIDYVGKEMRVYPSAQYYADMASDTQAQTPQEEQANVSSISGYIGGLLFGNRGQLDDKQTVDEHSERAIDAENEEEREEDKENDDEETKESKKKLQEPLRFICPSATFAKHLWKYTLGQKVFFTQDHAKDVKPVTSSARVPLPFIRGSTFRYSGRVLHEIQEEQNDPNISAAEPRKLNFIRYHVERQPGRNERTYAWMVGKEKAATIPRTASKGNSDTEQANINTLHYEGKNNAVAPIDESHEAADIAASAKNLAESKALNDLLDQSPTVDLSPAISNGAVNSNSTLKAEEKPQPESKGTKTTTITIKTKQQNGTIAHETPASSDVDVVKLEAKSGICATVLRTILLTLLLIILLTAIVIALEESHNEHVQETLSKIPRHDEFRHLYYEPIRQHALDTFDKITKRHQSRWF